MTTESTMSYLDKIHTGDCLGGITLYNADCIELMREIPCNSIDCILTDPPYLYLKGQKLDRPFNEAVFFNEVKRVLKKDGFIVLFGRGTSFYRWNTTLAELGFRFKEEFVWDKSYCTSPLMAISRVHETISIHTKSKGIINRVKVPYLEMKGHDINAICVDLKRFLSGVKNQNSLNAVLSFLENNNVDYCPSTTKYRVSTRGEYGSIDRCVTVASQVANGLNEKSIIRNDFDSISPRCASHRAIPTGDRAVNALQSIEVGQNEKTIIRQVREHYSAIHPTQKPVSLLERLLALVTKEGDVVLDPFMGSSSTGIACVNMGRKFTGIELDADYYASAKQRIINHQMQAKLF